MNSLLDVLENVMSREKPYPHAEVIQCLSTEVTPYEYRTGDPKRLLNRITEVIVQYCPTYPETRATMIDKEYEYARLDVNAIKSRYVTHVEPRSIIRRDVLENLILHNEMLLKKYPVIDSDVFVLDDVVAYISKPKWLVCCYDVVLCFLHFYDDTKRVQHQLIVRASEGPCCMFDDEGTRAFLQMFLSLRAKDISIEKEFKASSTCLLLQYLPRREFDMSVRSMNEIGRNLEDILQIHTYDSMCTVIRERFPSMIR